MSDNVYPPAKCKSTAWRCRSGKLRTARSTVDVQRAGNLLYQRDPGIFVSRNYRLQPTDKPVIYFEERPSGAPLAVKAFFYPGDQFGEEFVYPQDRATELARANHQNVLSMSNDMKGNITPPAKGSKSASVQALKDTKVGGVSPTGEPVNMMVIVSTTP